MADKIQIKRSAVEGKIPTTSNLDLGELAVNTFDGKLYSKKNDGAEEVFQIGPVDSVNGQTGHVSISIDTQLEEQTLSASQTTINLSSITLASARPQLYIEGSFEQDFTVTNNTTIELGQSFPSGTRVFILQNVLSF